MKTDQTVDSRLAQTRQMQQQLQAEPVIGKLTLLKKIFYKLTHSTFSRQFNLNQSILNLIEAFYHEFEQSRAEQNRQIAELQGQLTPFRQQQANLNGHNTDAIERIPRWIRESVEGKSFADLGGIGVNAVNERVTLAVHSGAQSATMIDIRPQTYYEWKLFHQKCAEQGITDYNSIDCIDINDPLLVDKVGMYDVVHSTGIMYHMPCPVWSMYNLTRIVKDILIVNTVIVPPRIETEYGALEFSGNQVLFLPGISEQERMILKSYYLRKFGWSIDDYAPALDHPEAAKMPWFENGEFSCWPYWWLFTEQSFRGLVNMMGLEILDSCLWENHALTFLTRKSRQVTHLPAEFAGVSIAP